MCCHLRSLLAYRRLLLKAEEVKEVLDGFLNAALCSICSWEAVKCRPAWRRLEGMSLPKHQLACQAEQAAREPPRSHLPSRINSC